MIFIYTDCVSTREAKNIGRILVREGLAACASWWRTTSTYYWQGRLQEHGEVALLIKTGERTYTKAARRLRALHSYKLPTLVAWRSSHILAPYERWVRQATLGAVRPGGTHSTVASRLSLARRRPARG